MWRGHGSLPLVVEEEKRGTSASIHALCLPLRCHARSCFHAPRKGMNGPQLAVGVLGTRNTRLFRGSSPGNVPQGRRLFLRSFCVLLHAPSAVHPTVSCRRLSKELGHLEEHGRVFPSGPSPDNPYTLQFSRCSSHILLVQTKNGHARAQATIASPLPLKRRGLRRAQALLCQHICGECSHGKWVKNARNRIIW